MVFRNHFIDTRYDTSPVLNNMNRIKCGVLGGGVGGRGQFLGLKYAYIPNLSPLLSLEPFEKFLVGGG